MSHSREPMSAVDAAWLRMDSDTNPMMITALLVFAEPVGFDTLAATVRERLLRHDRFRRRAVEHVLGSPHWEEDPHFDLSNHFHRVALPAPGGKEELRRMIGDLMSTPLDRSRPLWQLHVIQGYDATTTVIARLHHCIGDGVALVGVLLGITDEGAGLSPQDVGVTAAPVPQRVVDVARQMKEQAAAVGKNLLLPAEPPNPFRGALGTRKAGAWSDAVPLETVKHVGRTLGGTVNDVLMTATSGALRRYLLDCGEAPSDLRALVPVFVRGASPSGELGNHFGLVFAPMPLATADPRERFRTIKARMDEVKSSPEAHAALGVLAAMGIASAELEHVGVEIFTKKASVMVTNVPGPPSALHLAGSRIRDLMVWAPVAGHVGLGISLLSYAGHVRMGVASDEGLVPEPEAITTAFVDELEELATRNAAP